MYACKSLTEFYQISLKILPHLTDFSSQLMACMDTEIYFLFLSLEAQILLKGKKLPVGGGGGGGGGANFVVSYCFQLV